MKRQDNVAMKRLIGLALLILAVTYVVISTVLLALFWLSAPFGGE